MALCPPNKGVLRETSGWGKLVDSLRDKYGENAERMVEYAFYQKGDVPTKQEVLNYLSKSEKKSLSQTVKKGINDMVKEMSKKTKEMMGYNYGFAEGSLAGQVSGKREGREEGVKVGKKELESLQKEMSNKLLAYLKTNESLVGKLSEKQINAIIKRANELGYSEAKYKKLTEYIDKVISKENYLEDLSNGQSMQQKLTKPLANAADLIKRMKSISLSDLTAKELIDFNSVAKSFINSKKPISSGLYEPFDANNAEKIISAIESSVSGRRVDDMKNMYGIIDLNAEEANLIEDYMASSNKDEYLANLEEAKKKELRFNMERIANYSLLGLKDKLSTEKPMLESLFGKNFVEKLDRISNLDTSKIVDTAQLSELTKIVDNMIINNTNANIGNAYSIVLANENLPKLSKLSKTVVVSTLNRIGQAYYDTAIVLKAIFGDRKVSGPVRALTGLEQVYNAGGLAETQTYTARKSWDKFRKENGISNDAETDFITKVYARLNDVRVGKEDEDYQNEKKQLELSIERLKASKKKEDNDMGGFLDAIYTELVSGVETHREFAEKAKKIYPKEVDSADWVSKNMWEKKKQEFKRHAEENLNETFDAEERPNYHPKTYMRIYDRVEVDSPDSRDPKIDVVNPKETGRSKERTLRGVLPEDKVVDYRFEYSTFKTYQDEIFEIESYEAAKTFKYMSKIKGFDEIFGGEQNANFVKNTYNQQYKTLRYGQKNADVLSGSVGLSVLRSARNIGTAIGLARGTQFLTQATPAMSTIIQAGKYFYDVLRSGVSPEIKLFDYGIIGARGFEMGSIGKSESTQALSYTKTKRGVAKRLTQYSQWTGRNRDRVLKILAKTDESVARKSFLAYYLKYMNEVAGIKTTAKDLSTEHLRMDETRKIAISYAQQAVDETQGSSSRVLLSELKRNDSGSSIAEIMKTIAMPFNNFASNTKARIIEDGRKLMIGNKEQKIEAGLDLLGTTIESTAFAGINAFVLGGVLRYGIKQVFSKIFGIDNDEELYAAVSSRFKQFYTNVTREMLFSGVGGTVENAGIEAANRVAYWMMTMSGNESGKDYYEWLRKDPMFKPPFEQKKEGLSNVISNLGGYGIAFRTGMDGYNDVSGAITGEVKSEYTFSKQVGKGGVSGKLSGDFEKVVRLNDNQRNYYMFMGLLNGAAIFTGYTDADILRATQSMKYDIEKKGSKSQYPKKVKKSGFMGGGFGSAGGLGKSGF